MEIMLSFLNEKSRNLTSLRLKRSNPSPPIAPPARTSSFAKWKTWMEVHSTKDTMRTALLLGAQAYFLGQSVYHLTHIFPRSLKFRPRTSEVNPFQSHQVKQSEIKPGDHIYTWTAGRVYSHHGVYVAKNMVVHFSAAEHGSSGSVNSLFSDFLFTSPKHQAPCSISWCGFRGCGNGVVVSCLGCFSRNRSLYLFQYEVGTYGFFLKLRGGTCTTAKSDPPGPVIERAMHLLKYGFGPYNVVMNNCEDFALYCKTGILTIENLGIGTSGQASSLIGAPLAALLSSPLKFLIPSPVGVATVTAGMYCMSRYATDIGVRTDVVKVAVEDLAINLGWMDGLKEALQENEASSQAIKEVINID